MAILLDAIDRAAGAPVGTPLREPGRMRTRVESALAEVAMPVPFAPALAGLVLMHTWLCDDGVPVHLDRLATNAGAPSDVLQELAAKACVVAEREAAASTARLRKLDATIAKSRREAVELVENGSAVSSALARVAQANDLPIATIAGDDLAFTESLTAAEKAANKRQSTRLDFGSVSRVLAGANGTGSLASAPVLPTPAGEPDYARQRIEPPPDGDAG